eukprot:13962923-Ditylum_brightwellii.AAC.1
MCQLPPFYGKATITRDMKIIINKSLDHNRPDIVILEKEDEKAQILDNIVPTDKIAKYRDLKITLKQNWK